MKRLFAAVCVSAVLLMAGASAVRADDLYPPDWRGDPGSTYQQWEFSTDNTTPPPDDVVNPYGTPSLTVIPYGSYKPEWNGRYGVWPLSGFVIANIPNNPVENLYKLVQIQLTWTVEPGQTTIPCVGLTATLANGMPVSEEFIILLDEQTDDTLGQGWYHTTYLYKIIPNPVTETVYISSSIMIDELVIDTICIPEPATLGLLGIGGVLILVRRRGRK